MKRRRNQGDPESAALSDAMRPRLSRRGMARGALTLAAAWSLAACGALPGFEPAAGAPPPPPRPVGRLGFLTGGSDTLVVADRELDLALLRRFYARHDFDPVWPTRQAQVGALVNAVLSAGDHGLDPELFHASLLLRRASLAPLQRELLLSDAFLSYADALARGAVPVERRGESQTLAPDPIDVAAALDAAIDSRDPLGAIESLAPRTPTYRALRQALRDQRSPGRARPGRVVDRTRTITVNLERQRWLPRPLPADRAWVNVADQRLTLYRAGAPVFTSRVIVGDDAERNQSPEFRTLIQASFFNPPWVIPRDIVVREILPKIHRDPTYLTRNNMFFRDNGEIEQRAGPTAGLGAIMFDMPNRFDVYLHDTPNQLPFARDNRRISHGCIRVENPRAFAALLMRRPVDAIDAAIATGDTIRQILPAPVPVFLTYETAFVDADGALQFRPDFYDRDAALWRQLQARPEGARDPEARPLLAARAGL